MLSAIQRKKEVNESKPVNKSKPSTVEPVDAPKPQKPVTPRKPRKPKILTRDLVYEFIQEQSGKWGGFATLLAVIKRHKAKSTSVVDAIIDIHRKFKDLM